METEQVPQINGLVKAARRTMRAGLDLVLPPACLACRGAVDIPGALCGACWSKVTFITKPYCDVCGAPFAFAAQGASTCTACLARPPRYARARSAMVYDDMGRDIVLSFKLRDRLEGAESFAAWMIRAGGELLEPGTILVPVPLHRWRLFNRRFNQAAILARAIAHQTGLFCDPMFLRRARPTPSQRGLSAKARRRNVAGAFIIRQGHEARLPNGSLKGARIVLIDDVLTTGATAEACARLLLLNGAAHVDVLTLARVEGPQTQM